MTDQGFHRMIAWCDLSRSFRSERWHRVVGLSGMRLWACLQGQIACVARHRSHSTLLEHGQRGAAKVSSRGPGWRMHVERSPTTSAPLSSVPVSPLELSEMRSCAIRRCLVTFTSAMSRGQAAADRGRGAAAAVDSNRTDTLFETPDSSIVTP